MYHNNAYKMVANVQLNRLFHAGTTIITHYTVMNMLLMMVDRD